MSQICHSKNKRYTTILRRSVRSNGYNYLLSRTSAPELNQTVEKTKFDQKQTLQLIFKTWNKIGRLVEYENYEGPRGRLFR